MDKETTLDIDQLGHKPLPSKFVNRLSWIFLLIAGSLTFYGLYTLLIFQGFSRRGHITGPSDSFILDYEFAILNWIGNFYFQNQFFFDVGFLIGAILLFFASIGLLNRKTLARNIFILLLYLHIIYNLFRMSVLVYFARLTRTIDPIETDAAWNMINIAEWILIIYPSYTVILYFLYRWIHRKLKQPQILAEFS